MAILAIHRPALQGGSAAKQYELLLVNYPAQRIEALALSPRAKGGSCGLARPDHHPAIQED
jgi:hypothetical protein